MDNSRIITVTLSPSLDRTIGTRYLALGYHNLVDGSTRLDPAGAGVGVSRALHRLRRSTHALILLGDDATARAYEALMQLESFPVTFIRSEGPTRSVTIIVDTGNETETHLVEESAPLNEEGVDRIVTELETIVGHNDTLVFAGPLPPVRPSGSFRRLVEVGNRLGARTVAALGIEQLDDVLASELTMITLTQLQAEALFNFPVRGPEEVAYCARVLREKGIPTVLIEMPDTASAFLATADEEWLITLPEGEPGTSSGVWEALLAGFLAGVDRRQPLDVALEFGAAAASYTASQLGSEFGTAAEIQQHLDEITVQRLRQDEAADDDE